MSGPPFNQFLCVVCGKTNRGVRLHRDCDLEIKRRLKQWRDEADWLDDRDWRDVLRQDELRQREAP